MLPNKRQFNKQNKKSILAFFGQKSAKIYQKEENWQNPNGLIKFSEICYVNASQQKKIQQKKYF